MHKIVLLTAMAFFLGSAHAQTTPTVAPVAPTASEPKGEPTHTAELPAPEQPTPQAPAVIERPKLIPVEQNRIPAPIQRPITSEKPRKKRESTEARVIYELHRHGIYW
jgi:outer membrane biosynthesis protein TonB